MKQTLLKKINEKTAVVGVVGLGYVGLPLAVEKAKAGYKVIGFDVQAERVNMVNEGHNYIGDIVDKDLQMVIKDGLLKATVDYSLIKEVDCVAICVPTPLDAYQQPDISYVKASAEEIAKHMHAGMLVVLESTTYPGTTRELVKPIIEKISGLQCEKDFYLAFSPERVDPGNAYFKTKNTPKVVGGIGKDSTELAAALYGSILESDIFQVSSPEVAEMEKILENTYRNINIGLANEMAIICDKMGINVWEVIEAAKTKPYGFQAFYPGPGIGGHCIPLDPYYLTWKAREYDYHTRLIEISGEINNYMPQYVVERSSRILNRFGKPLKDSKILILGIAYKQDIDDYRESPALKLIDNFSKEGSIVSYYDPYVTKFKYKGKRYEGCEFSKEMLRSMDLVVVTTAHSTVDYEFVQKNSKMVFDTKNAMKKVEARNNIEVL
ncbi:MAG: nucleotide sugar dehydrogenase [Deltaproteobacteria bacterium]